MKRKGMYKPTIEDIIELSGVETLHPGGFALTKRTAELTEMGPGMKVLDVSSGRGTQSIFYAQDYGVEVTGIDLAEEMVQTATENATNAGLTDRVNFKIADAQALPFEDNRYDVVINECAVGIPDDSQAVLNEMVRVAKPGGKIAIHESTWRTKLPEEEKDEISEHYGTTPLEYEEWIAMLKKAGVKEIITEFDQWSKPEMFWKIRKDRDVEHHSQILTKREMTKTLQRIIKVYGEEGLNKAFKNQEVFYDAVLSGKLGYCLFKGIK